MAILASIYASDLPHRARTVYIYLRDRSDKEGKCWPGIRTIGRELGLSQSTVKRALNDLERAGHIKRQPRYRKNGSSTSNLYCLQ